jgi:hypothetical protein
MQNLTSDDLQSVLRLLPADKRQKYAALANALADPTEIIGDSI